MRINLKESILSIKMLRKTLIDDFRWFRVLTSFHLNVKYYDLREVYE